MEYNVLQIGAHIGWTNNNQFVLNKINNRSKCLFVEPIKELYDVLVSNFNRVYPNNEFVFLNHAVGSENGHITLYKPLIGLHTFNEPYYIEKELPYFVDMLTSIHPKHVDDHYIKVDVEEISVECHTINQIILNNQITELDYLVIDTEGNDFHILFPLDFNLLKPKTIKFEHKHMEGTNTVVGENYSRLMEKLTTNGYHVVSVDDEDTVVSLD
jgi:FkbM family methyltransferase